MSTTDAVAQLNDAEKMASEIIDTARREKEKKIREAKSAAEFEINNLRNLQETEYQKTLSNRFLSDKEENDLLKQTQEEVHQIFDQFHHSKDAAVNLLIERVIHVDVSIPQVIKGQYDQKKK